MNNATNIKSVTCMLRLSLRAKQCLITSTNLAREAITATRPGR